MSAERIEYKGNGGSQTDAVIPLLIDIKIIMTISKEITTSEFEYKV